MSFIGLLPQPPYPWLIDAWQNFVGRVERGRLAHALLIVGPSGLGCLELAKAMAQYLLCVAPQPGRSCGQCKSCLLLLAESHPDLHWVQPEESSQSIKIGQIRDLSELTSNTAQQGGRKLIVINPAEAMNANAANALLKSLEEPSGNCVYILVTEQPAFLTATIRSRCSRVLIHAPKMQDAVTWLERNRVDDAEALLAAAGGRPLRVMEWLANDIWGQRRQLANELRKLLAGSVTFLDCAKSLVGFGPLWVTEQLQSWLVDTLRLQHGVRSIAGDDLVDDLARVNPAKLLHFYELIQRKKALLLSSSNPNPQMVMDELMMEIKDLYRKND